MVGEDIYRKMVLIRESEKRICKEYPTDELKTPVHLGIGAEAISVGVTSILPEGTKYFGTYRNHALYLALGGDLDEFWGELYGKKTGCGKGKAGSMHLSAPDRGLILTSAVVGTTIPIAVGSAISNQYNNGRTTEGYPTVAFFGDGATEEGVFHESLNFAALHRLRILFVCEDNGLAIHNPTRHRQAYSLRELIQSYGIMYRSCNGAKIDLVRSATSSLATYLKNGPCFLHATYHRFLEHVGANEDYTAGYRVRPEVPSELDPIHNLEYATAVLSVPIQRRNEIKREMLALIDASVSRAKAAEFPAPEELYTDVFED